MLNVKGNFRKPLNFKKRRRKFPPFFLINVKGVRKFPHPLEYQKKGGENLRLSFISMKSVRKLPHTLEY